MLHRPGSEAPPSEQTDAQTRLCHLLQATDTATEEAGSVRYADDVAALAPASPSEQTNAQTRLRHLLQATDTGTEDTGSVRRADDSILQKIYARGDKYHKHGLREWRLSCRTAEYSCGTAVERRTAVEQRTAVVQLTAVVQRSPHATSLFVTSSTTRPFLSTVERKEEKTTQGWQHLKHGLRKRRRSCRTAESSRYQADLNP